MELRHLRYFLAVAEELSFTRAARRLGIAQPPLSSQIRSLEEELGVRLFVRSPQRVLLTAPGEVLLAETRRILAHVDDAVRATQLAGEGGAGRVVVGFIGSAMYDVLPRILRALRDRSPRLALSLRQQPTGEQMRSLATGAIHVGFVRAGPPGPGYGRLPLRSERIVAALPEGHALARRARIPLKALAKEELILFPRALGPVFYDEIVRLCEHAGFTPRVGQEANEMHTIIGLVAGGLGVALVPAAIGELGRPGVVFRPLVGEASQARVPLSMIWREDDVTPALAIFLAVARDVVKDSPPGNARRRRPSHVAREK